MVAMLSSKFDSYFIYPLICGYILDLIIGDPRWVPHPIRIFGKVIYYCEKTYNKGRNKTRKGIFVTMFLLSATWVIIWGLFKLILPFTYIYYPFATLFVFYGLANKSLISEALQVNRQLQLAGLQAGRKQLSHIVGRDTSMLSKNQVRIAILETLSENLSDGVIAPLFYFAIGGIPFMFVYKMANTLDSMIGYKNEQYRNFGMFAARVDDVLNFIPARLTAFFMVLLTLSFRGLYFVFKYGHRHTSPNAGYPESALAGILNCRFGGPNFYHGKVVVKPFIGKNDRVITKSDILKACTLNVIVSFVCVFFICFCSFLF